MKVVITAVEPDLDSPVDPRFGRCGYFLLFDTESDQFTSHDNAPNLNAPQGAGIQAAEAVVRLGAEAVLTGNVGPKAFATLRAGNLQVYPGLTGSVREALDRLRSGRLQPAPQPTVEGHWA
jgi:predicted Fe-Mo cluster-binding NifX family protein